MPVMRYEVALGRNQELSLRCSASRTIGLNKSPKWLGAASFAQSALWMSHHGSAAAEI
jgi:hypothetical protein